MAFPRRRRYGGGGFGGGNFGAVGFDFRLTPWVKRLLIVNTAVFLLMLLGVLPDRWAFSTFGFSPEDAFRHPWSPLTYMFVHAGFWHLFFNMVGVFFFGPPLERKWGSRYFIQFYVAAGLGGALFSVLMIPVIGTSQVVVGASGALYGLLLAFAMNWPEAPIYIWGILPVKAKWFVAFFGFLALWGTVFGSGGGVAHWAHLGGLVTGYGFLRYGDRIARGVERLFFKKEKGKVKEKGRPVVIRRESGRVREVRPPRRRRGVDGDTLDRVDEILDKIREQGIDSLTSEEREFLDEVSRRYQQAP